MRLSIDDANQNSSCRNEDNEEFFVLTTPDALDCARKLIECPPTEGVFNIPRIDVELYVKSASVTTPMQLAALDYVYACHLGIHQSALQKSLCCPFQEK